MTITVAERYRPYSHKAGSSCLIPGEEKLITMWPAKSVIRQFDTNEILAEGAGSKTLVQDLEKPFGTERLSFGNHKSQDVDMIRRRKDLKEILPLWFKLATYYPKKEEVQPGSLLYDLIHETDRNKMCDLLMKVYLSGFSPFFVPRATDEDFNGFDKPPILDESPLVLLSEGACAIRRMIVDQQDDTLFVLPNLPSAFSTGRLIDTPVPKGVISVEWTKHFLRRVIYTPYDADDVNIKFPKEVKGYRVTASDKSRVFDNNTSGKSLVFDNFRA